MNTYQKNKQRAREKAIEWQCGADERIESYSDIARASIRFERMAKRYGLTREFKENGII
jgi:hypothetical protein